MQTKTKNYCLVGFGNHAKNKLLPSLERDQKNIFGIVSSKQRHNFEYTHYNNLQEALKKSNKSTIFVIASPPNAHFVQIKKIIKTERNVFVEKPIFTGSYQVKIIENFLKEKNLFIVELLMYKYTKLYEKFKKTWEKKKKLCTKIECFFNIPSVPYGTFRSNIDITSSPLYDIGCYIFSLLVDLKIPIESLKISNKILKNGKILSLSLSGCYKDLEIYTEFGIKNEYKNLVNLRFGKDNYITFEKFFYGMKEKKQISFRKTNKCKVLIIEDHNGFEKIFNYPDSFWLQNQSDRFQNISLVNQKLSSLKAELNLLRKIK